MEYRTNPPLAIRTFGHVKNDPYHSTLGTKQGDVMLTLFTGGEGRFKQKGQIQKVREGMIGLVTPEDEGILLCHPRNPYEHYYARFSGAYARYLTETIREERGSCFFREPAFREYAARLSSFHTVFHHHLPYHMDELAVTVLGIIVDLQKIKITANNPLDNSEALISYLQDRITKPTNLREIAEELHVSRSTLTTRCRSLCGKSIQQLHESLKMEWALELLQSGNLRITEIANRLGYSDSLYFSKVFKKHYGSSPRSFKKDT